MKLRKYDGFSQPQLVSYCALRATQKFSRLMLTIAAQKQINHILRFMWNKLLYRINPALIVRIDRTDRSEFVG